MFVGEFLLIYSFHAKAIESMTGESTLYIVSFDYKLVPPPGGIPDDLCNSTGWDLAVKIKKNLLSSPNMWFSTNVRSDSGRVREVTRHKIINTV